MRFQVWERSAAPSPRSSRRWRRGYHGRYFSIKSSARCESAPNFDPQPYRCKHLKDKRIDVIMRGQNWTPVKFSESCKFRCCFNWLWLGWGGVKVRRRFTLKLIARGSFKRFQPMAGARLPMSKRCGAGEGHRDMFAQLHLDLAYCPACQRAQAVRHYARRRR